MGDSSKGEKCEIYALDQAQKTEGTMAGGTFCHEALNRDVLHVTKFLRHHANANVVRLDESNQIHPVTETVGNESESKFERQQLKVSKTSKPGITVTTATTVNFLTQFMYEKQYYVAQLIKCLRRYRVLCTTRLKKA